MGRIYEQKTFHAGQKVKVFPGKELAIAWPDEYVRAGPLIGTVPLTNERNLLPDFFAPHPVAKKLAHVFLCCCNFSTGKIGEVKNLTPRRKRFKTESI